MKYDKYGVLISEILADGEECYSCVARAEVEVLLTKNQGEK